MTGRVWSSRELALLRPDPATILRANVGAQS
jgi:hypothetical protein